MNGAAQGIERFRGRFKAQRRTAMRQDWRRKRFKQQNERCFYCSAPMVIEAGKFNAHRLCTLDHRQPISRGGIDHYENTAAACHRCNQAKRSMTEAEFREALSTVS